MPPAAPESPATAKLLSLLTLLTIPSPFADHPGLVRLLEPADAPLAPLQAVPPR